MVFHIVIYRYGGYVTQLKYQLGDTFGIHTHKLLTDPNVVCSGNSVLASTEVTQAPPAAKTAVSTWTKA